MSAAATKEYLATADIYRPAYGKNPHHMAAAKKPQSKFHMAKVSENALLRIEENRKAALSNAPEFVNGRFNKKRLQAIGKIHDEVVPLLVAGGVVTAGEVEAAKMAILEEQTAPSDGPFARQVGG